MKIEYAEDTGLYVKLIMLMANSAELDQFKRDIVHKRHFEFRQTDGSEVSILERCMNSDYICIDISEETALEISHVCEGLLSHSLPRHNFVDLDGGYTLMISKDEYHR